MEQRYSISVIIPVYNGEETLSRCMDSILNSYCQRLEIILVDDGSTDNTAKLGKEYAKRYSWITYIYQKNQGVVAARLRGLQESSGKYISFIDADDWCEEGRFQKIQRDIDVSGADLLIFSAVVYRENGEGIIRNTSLQPDLYNAKDIYGDYLYLLFGRLCLDQVEAAGYLWNCVFCRKLLDGIEEYIDINLLEDEIIVMQGLLHAETVWISQEKLYHYDRTKANSLSRRNHYWEGYWDNILRVYEYKKKIGTNYSLNYDEYEKRLSTFLLHNFLRAIMNETHYTNPKGFWKGLIKSCTLLGKKEVLKCMYLYEKMDFFSMKKYVYGWHYTE